MGDYDAIVKDLPDARKLVYAALDKLADLDPRAAAKALAEAAAEIVRKTNGRKADFDNLVEAAWNTRAPGRPG